MTHLLDTNACIDHLRAGGSSPITVRLASASAGSVAICTIVIGELYFGARRSAHPARTLAEVQRFCSRFVVLSFDEPSAREFAEIRAHLTSLGQIIGPYDLMIAAIARANGLILVTHNTSEFSRVPGLNIEDWQLP